MSDSKQRNGCLTAWLCFLILLNSTFSLTNYFALNQLQQRFDGLPSWYFSFGILIGVCNIVFAVALFLWKKWGFWGFAICSLAGAGFDTWLGLDLPSVLGRILGLAVVYCLLHLGKEKKAWTQLS